MKLKILPPTIREKKRYIAFELFSQKNIQKEDIIILFWNSILEIYGEVQTSKINLWLIELNKIKSNKDYKYKGIVKCRRGYEDELITGLTAITRYKNNRIVVHTLSTSGTIKSLNEKYKIIKQN